MVSGTTGFDYARMTLDPDVVHQTHQTFRNISSALEKAGSSLNEVVRLRVYLARAEDFEAYHSGYFNGVASGDPNYILPLRSVRQLEQEGKIGRVHPTIYGLPGVGTPVASARRLGEQIAQELRQADVGGALLVAT